MISPMMQHYLNTKEEYKDCILFYRLGDFYEMFFDDALLVSKELELTLTGKDCGLEERAPMCGVPHHSADIYITKLVKNGHKVALCEQMEDPKNCKGIVKREVVKIITPGTVCDPESLDEGKNNYLMAITYFGDLFGISYIDYSTGEFFVTEVSDVVTLKDEICRITPAEIISNEYFFLSGIDIQDISVRLNIAVSTVDNIEVDLQSAYETIKPYLNSEELIEIKGLKEGVLSAEMIINYLAETQKNVVNHISVLHKYDTEKYMIVDASTCRNLELVETMRDKSKRGSLLYVLDKTKTAMGKRMLRKMTEQPLSSQSEINKRLDAVEKLTKVAMDREEIREYLGYVYDIERLLGKICTGTATPRDLLSFKCSLMQLPNIRYVIARFEESLFQECYKNIYDCTDITSLLERAIEEEPPLSIKDGGIIKTGYDPQVDEYRSAKTDGAKWLAELEARERDNTGIKNLKVKYNKVFGYYLEVTNSYKDMVPVEWTRKQTLTNAERYITPELKDLENTILGAHEKMASLEYSLFVKIREFIAGEADRLKKIAQAIATLDVFTSLAKVAEQNAYVRPNINTQGVIKIKNGRHPVIEQMIPANTFVANDTELNNTTERIALITGPNMAGKSTYMRQTALITLMAHMGSFVPASSANICITDRIFTRVGASDDLASGRSTFMVEMSEVANILKNATKNSLLILDEIGRGTGTLDGLSIARAVIEYVANINVCGAKTLFATHYHELTELDKELECLKNLSVAVKENGDEIIFLRKIVPGGADKSYGIHVAGLAGVPEPVINRAKELLFMYSTDEAFEFKIHEGNSLNNEAKVAEEIKQYSIFEEEKCEQDDARNKVCAEIKSCVIEQMTPFQAMQKLMELKEML